MMSPKASLIAVIAVVGCSTSLNAAELKAFPGAEGFGANAQGGRGGRVIYVTNLNDNGNGSLRAACAADDARTIVFQVGGTIDLESGITISNPYVTIAGQTAPGGGITLRNKLGNTQTPIKIKTHDVVVRYLRSRPGSGGGRSSKLDALAVGPGSYNVVIDHCSFSWSVDELAGTWGDAHHVTFQWNILSEALHNSLHEEGPHSKGMSLGAAEAHSITIYHNLFANNWERNPRINHIEDGHVDVINNVIFNSGGKNAQGWAASHISAEATANYVGNYFQPGTDTMTTGYFISADGAARIYVKGNVSPKRFDDGVDEATGVVRPKNKSHVVKQRFASAKVSETDAATAYEQALTLAGASAFVTVKGWVPRRDDVDARVVKRVADGVGRIIDDPIDVGGWPELSAGSPLLDTDQDGMPDEWELSHGLDPRDPRDNRNDSDNDGYLNLEEYLNGTSP